MRKLAIIAILGIWVCNTNNLHAQIFNQYNMYFEDLYTVNPAAANQNDFFRAGLNTNLANTGFYGSPKAMRLFISGPVNDNTGIGLRVVNDSRGAFNTNNVIGSYAYKIKLGSGEHVISMGLSAGVYWQSFDISSIDALFPDDDVLYSEYTNKKYFMNEIGIHYSWKDLNVGFSAPYVLQLYNQYMAYTSYNYAVPGVDGFNILPMVLYQYLPEMKSQVDAGVKFMYDIVWASFSYRTNNAILAAIGVNYNKYNIAYSFGFNNSQLTTIATGTHEIMLSYNFNIDFSSKKASYDKDKMPWQE